MNGQFLHQHVCSLCQRESFRAEELAQFNNNNFRCNYFSKHTTGHQLMPQQQVDISGHTFTLPNSLYLLM